MAKLHNIKYPHLLPEDVPVWERYLDLYNSQYLRLEYDVRVGNGQPANPSLPANIQKMAIDLSQKRIDAVGWTEAAIHIIEITRRAGIKAIGQLTTYPVLYAQSFRAPLPLIPVLVCEELLPDIDPVIQRYNIKTFILPEVS